MELTELDDVASLQLTECCSSTDNVTAITHKAGHNFFIYLIYIFYFTLLQSPIHGMFLTTQLCSIRDNEMLCDVTLVRVCFFSSFAYQVIPYNGTISPPEEGFDSRFFFIFAET